MTIQASGEIKDCDYTRGSCRIVGLKTCLCDGGGLSAGEGGRYYVTIVEPTDQQNRSAIVTISSDLPDPDLTNNDQAFINLDNVVYQSTPPPNQPVVNDPSQQGGH